MRLLSALFFSYLVLSCAAISVRTESVKVNNLLTSKKLTSTQVYPLGNTAASKPQLSLCPLCVNFMDESINALLNIILQGGVLGSCSALCGQLKSQVEAVVCNLLCDYVGINVFMDLINDADPDPIWICEEIKVCPVCDGAANITSLTVSPPAGPKGTTFDITMQFQVTTAICTGEIAIEINPPASSGAFPFGDASLIEGAAVGSYGVKFQLQAEPSQQEPFSKGNYQVIMAICAGTCGSIHSHSKIYTQKTTTFAIN